MSKYSFIPVAALLGLLTASAHAQDYVVGNIEIHDPHIRATPPKASVAGGYMTIRNGGSEPDRLVGGSADFAEKVEIHEMKMEGDVMKMREIEGGVEIPPGGEIVLKPGGFHMMFTGLDEQLVAGETRSASLQFEHAGTIALEFEVRDMH